jgi:hypothetical protein
MSLSEILFWKRVGEDLGIDVVTPFEVSFPDGSRVQVSALVRDFGAARGMLVDADYEILKPHTHKVIECGYGYSANLGHSPEQYDRSAFIEVLQDWGWSGAAHKKPDWL